MITFTQIMLFPSHHFSLPPKSTPRSSLSASFLIVKLGETKSYLFLLKKNKPNQHDVDCIANAWIME